jgi:hypothetical protein
MGDTRDETKELKKDRRTSSNQINGRRSAFCKYVCHEDNVWVCGGMVTQKSTHHRKTTMKITILFF